jgi:hypothetical protein
MASELGYGTIRCVNLLIEQICDSIAHWNIGAKPLIWTTMLRSNGLSERLEDPSRRIAVSWIVVP